MKSFMLSIIFSIFVFGLFSYLLTTKENRKYTDEELRHTALSRNMSSITANFEDIKELIDTPKNRLTKEKIDLGKKLYFDTILSNEEDISCNTCHMINKDNNKNKPYSTMLLSDKKHSPNNCVVCHLSDQSGTDRLSTAIGNRGQENPQHLNTLSILNAALAKYLTWDGSVDSVEQEAGNSIKDPYKMHMSISEVLNRLSMKSTYVEKFKNVFQDSQNTQLPTITFTNVENAIGAYVRTLLTRSDYDKFLDGDDNAISEEAKRGFANFINFGCKGCHTGRSVGGQSLQKFPLRSYNSIFDLTTSVNQGIKGRELSYFGFNFNFSRPFPFDNTGDFMGKDHKKLFRVPILRNVTKTSPYFHNGAVAKLRDAIHLMAKHQLGINITDTQTDEIIAFFNTLEGNPINYSIDPKDTL